MVCGLVAVIVAVGVFNTFISTRVGKLVPSEELGAMYGLFESIEKVGGICGPLAGGVLAQLHEDMPLACLTLMYLGLIYWLHNCWHRVMANSNHKSETHQD